MNIIHIIRSVKLKLFDINIVNLRAEIFFFIDLFFDTFFF